MASGSGIGFGETYVIEPTGVHKATVVWLHDVGRIGSDSLQALRSVAIPNIKWICPTAPKRHITSLGGKKTTAWFDIYTRYSEDMRDDLGSMNEVATYVASLLSHEPHHVIKGVGGIGMGGSQALFYASSCVFGQVPIEVKFVIGVNSWFHDSRSLQSKMDQNPRKFLCAYSIRILIIHTTSGNDTIPSALVNTCVNNLRLFGFQTFLRPSERANLMNEIRGWLVRYVF